MSGDRKRAPVLGGRLPRGAALKRVGRGLLAAGWLLAAAAAGRAEPPAPFYESLSLRTAQGVAVVDGRDGLMWMWMTTGEFPSGWAPKPLTAAAAEEGEPAAGDRQAPGTAPEPQPGRAAGAQPR